MGSDAYIAAAAAKALRKRAANLAPLLERAVVKEIEVPLFQESRRRPSGGHLRVTMKLRQPLQGDDIRSIQRQMLVLDLLDVYLHMVIKHTKK